MLTRKTNLLIFCLLCVFSGLASGNNASNYYFTRIDGESGLSQNNVKAIYQDSWGFMWFGTRNRLNRYDGKSVKVFDCYDAALEQGNNNIGALAEDRLRRLWVGTDKGVFCFDPLTETFAFFGDSTATGVRMQDWVADIQCDRRGNIWTVIPNQGLFRYDQHRRQLSVYQLGEANLPNRGNAQSICVDENDDVWVGTNGGGIHGYHPETDSFVQYLGDGHGDSLAGENIYTLCSYGDELVVGIHEGKLRKWDKKKHTLRDIDAPQVHYQIIRDVKSYGSKIWVGTQAGLFVVDEFNNAVDWIHEEPMLEHALSDNRVEKIYRDREKGIWVGTNFGGANYLSDRSMRFEQYVPLTDPYSISSRRVREIKEDAAHRLWIGTEDGGLNLFDPARNAFQRVGDHTGFPLYSKNVLDVMVMDDEVWVGFFKNGLDVISLPSFRTTHYTQEMLGLDEGSIYALYQDSRGTVWLGNAWGVYTGDKRTRKFTRMDAFGLSYVYDIHEDSTGDIWVATMGNGIFRYNRETGRAVHYLHRPDDPASLSSNSVTDVMEDKAGNLWLSTDRGGICRYNRAEDTFTSFSIAQGLPDDVAYRIVEDRNGNLWFGTNNGLVRFNPSTYDVRIFTTRDGLPGNQFNYKAALAASSGLFYFGSLYGLIAFDPYEAATNEFVPPVFITQFTLFNRPVDLHAKDSPLKQSIVHTKRIVLNYDQSNIGFDFVALSYTAPLANDYAYKMEGIDYDWTYTTDNQSASYAKLPPGNYTFRVKGSNNDGVWNETGTAIEIEILPPWWDSKAAWLVYCLLVAGAAYGWFCWYRRRNERRNAERQRLFEAGKERELYHAKLEFFTAIAHEVRTPLTLINGPLETLREMDLPDPEVRKNLQLMGVNTNRLLGFINQLLDFRKVESNKLSLTLARENMAAILREITLEFEPVVKLQGKKVSLVLPPDPVVASIDKVEFGKILTNLYSNALKYSRQTIGVTLDVQPATFTITVCNDGELIPDDQREKIFEPFYQLKKDKRTASSSGIGLSLVRSLTELHNGRIHVQTAGGMNCFILEFPLAGDGVPVMEETPIVLTERAEEPPIFVFEPGQGHETYETVLVVEDNADMLAFIVDQLQKWFTVEQAASGEEGLRVLGQKRVDIIVSDVMMPGMDGFEFCNRVKEDLEYSHIPVVLLTAKNDLASKIKGLETGAEAYVEKPFSSHYLVMQLTTLLNNRRREREAFLQKPFIPVQQMGMNKGDERFMNRIIAIIHEHIADASFNVEKLAEITGMSRSSLHRKIRGLLELPPNDFIRLIRLKRAAEIIQEGDARVGEVCYQVGINSPSYFIKLFQKQFGMTPKDFEKHHRVDNAGSGGNEVK